MVLRACVATAVIVCLISATLGFFVWWREKPLIVEAVQPPSQPTVVRVEPGGPKKDDPKPSRVSSKGRRNVNREAPQESFDRNDYSTVTVAAACPEPKTQPQRVVESTVQYQQAEYRPAVKEPVRVDYQPAYNAPPPPPAPVERPTLVTRERSVSTPSDKITVVKPRISQDGRYFPENREKRGMSTKQKVGIAAGIGGAVVAGVLIGRAMN